jgi:hypothetical protein
MGADLEERMILRLGALTMTKATCQLGSHGRSVGHPRIAPSGHFRIPWEIGTVDRCQR